MNPDRVIPGQVVQADDLSDDSNGQARPQETFLHKVASGPLGPVGASMSGRHARTGLRDEDDEAEVSDSYDDTEVMPAMAPTASTVSTGYPAEADDMDAAAGDTAAHDLAADDDADDDATAATAEADSAVVDVTEVDATEAGVPVVATRTETVDETYTTDETDIPGATGIPVGTDTTGADADATDISAGTATTGVIGTAADESTAADTDVAETRADMFTPQVPAAPDGDEPLLGEAAGRIREEWRQVQASFVDDPRASVTAAAGVVADTAARLESLLRERQRSLRGSWDGNGQADTETLRQLMLTYRRLLTKLIS